MNEYLLVMLYAAAGSFMFRLRGGLFEEVLKKIPGWGTLTSRLVWSLFMSLPVFYLASSVPYFAVAMLLISWYIGIAPGWASSQYMQDGFRSVLLLSTRGLWLVFPSFIVYHSIYSINPIFMLAAGLMQGSVYYAAQKLFQTKYGADRSNEFAELMFGFVLSAGLALSVIV